MQIVRRDVELAFDPEAVPRDWCGDDPYRTTFMAALSLLFPEGEKFFVEAVKRLAPDVTAPELRAAITGFIGQEAMHGKQHRAFNDMLVAHGHPSAPVVDARLGAFLRFVRRRLPARSRLAVTCALEHFTAMLAEQLLRDARMREELDPSIRGLWLWHALEESEHKAVAYDVYLATGGGYARRAALMLATTAVFFAVHAAVHAWLLSERGALWKPWTWARGIAHFWLAPGYLRRLVPAYLQYFRPGFHPDDRDTTALLETWRAALFTDAGALRAS